MKVKLHNGYFKSYNTIYNCVIIIIIIIIIIAVNKFKLHTSDVCI